MENVSRDSYHKNPERDRRTVAMIPKISYPFL